MKKQYSIIITACLAFAIVSLNTNAQRYVDVAPGVGTLNNAIATDSDPGTAVFRLERGDQALYLLTGSIENNGFHLTIVAANGDGAMPLLQPKVPDGGESGRPFAVKGDITLKNLHVTGMDNLGGLTERILRCQADNIRVELDSCWLEHDGQAGIRVDNPGSSFFLTNTTIGPIGNPISPSNGRGLDDRGNNIDTLVMENCTFFNITSRIIRDDGGYIKHAVFRNNTVCNIAQRGITFGEVGFLDFKDNLFVNSAFIPSDNQSETRIVEIEPIGSTLIGMGITQTVNISHTSFYIDTAMVQKYLTDFFILMPVFNETAEEFINKGNTMSTIITEKVTFAKGPPFNESLVDHIFDSNLDPLEAPYWEVPPVPEGKFYHTELYYDFDYDGIATLTAASDGKHLGDRRWEAPIGGSSNVRDLNYNASGLSVHPIPVDNTATINFNLKSDADVSISVYNVVGKRVANIANSRYPAGENTVSWNGEMLETGMYILRMNTGTDVSTYKILKK